jgi:hypothetical protein
MAFPSAEPTRRPLGGIPRNAYYHNYYSFTEENFVIATRGTLLSGLSLEVLAAAGVEEL